MKKILISVFVILNFLTVNIFSQQKDINLSFQKDKTNKIFLDKVSETKPSFKYTKLELKEEFINLNSGKKSLDIGKVKENVLPQQQNKKSIALGILLSALLPGAGEFYAKSYVKSAIFFAVEAISWGAFALYQSKGDSQTEDFENYARTYWDVRKYARWLKNEGFEGSSPINPDEPNLEVLRNQIMECESQNFSHTLPVYYSQQYFELIGKYQNFQAGWTNLAHEPTKNPGPYWYETYKDPVFINYSMERQKANDYYNYAKTGIFVVVINHILSAADAAWSVSIFNQNLKMQSGFEIKRYTSPFTGYVGNLPSFNLRINF